MTYLFFFLVAVATLSTVMLWLVLRPRRPVPSPPIITAGTGSPELRTAPPGSIYCQIEQQDQRGEMKKWIMTDAGWVELQQDTSGTIDVPGSEP
jgi:hypothetical protein